LHWLWLTRNIKSCILTDNFLCKILVGTIDELYKTFHQFYVAFY
jgi:hypothetical protein